MPPLLGLYVHLCLCVSRTTQCLRCLGVSEVDACLFAIQYLQIHLEDFPVEIDSKLFTENPSICVFFRIAYAKYLKKIKVSDFHLIPGFPLYVATVA